MARGCARAWLLGEEGRVPAPRGRGGSTNRQPIPFRRSIPPLVRTNSRRKVLIGGTMGTCSYVLTGTDAGFEETFGSTCHGAGE